MSVRYLAGQEIITIKGPSLKELKSMAEQAPLRRARFCLHQNDQSKVHEMVIAFCQDSYMRPHKHHHKTESFHVIEGELLVVFFDEEGKITRSIHMQPVQQGGCFLYRLSNDLWHTVIPLSEYVVIHEVTNGPFIKEDSMFAPWAPDGSDQQAVQNFIMNIKKETRI